MSSFREFIRRAMPLLSMALTSARSNLIDGK
jgi:hypothetical protein